MSSSLKARLNSEENSFVQSGLVEDDDPLGGRFVKFDKIQSFLAFWGYWQRVRFVRVSGARYRVSFLWRTGPGCLEQKRTRGHGAPTGLFPRGWRGGRRWIR